MPVSSPGSFPSALHPQATAGQAPSTASIDFQPQAAVKLSIGLITVGNAHVKAFTFCQHSPSVKLCLVQVGNGIELEAVGLQFEPYWWLPCGVTWDSSRTVVVIKLLQTSALCVNILSWTSYIVVCIVECIGMYWHGMYCGQHWCVLFLVCIACIGMY